MGCPRPTCAECTQHCLLIHGKNKDPASQVSSFFKIMIGDNYSQVLFLPPKIARTMQDSIDKKTQLEDASGQTWAVTLSKCDGSLAFQQGWHDFSVGHALEVGDFLVFHYVRESHFVVRIYGRSGCEKLNFSKENGSRKRKRTNKHLSANDGNYHLTDSDLMNNCSPRASAISGSYIEIKESQPMVADNTEDIDKGDGGLQISRRTMITEELFYMTGRDAIRGHEDRRHSLYDLSEFEMQRTSGVDGTTRVLEDDRSPLHGIIPKLKAGADIVDKIPATEEVTNLEIPWRNEDIKTVENVISVSEKYSSNGNSFRLEQGRETNSSNDQILISKKEDSPRYSSQSAHQKFAAMSEFFVSPASVQTANCLSGESVKVVIPKQEEKSKEVCGFRDILDGKHPDTKECVQSSRRAGKAYDHPCKVVKTEPVDSFELTSADAVISVMITDGQSFVELPRRLPSSSSRGRLRTDKAVVLLRDPVSRLWPVLYQERSKMAALTSGWEAFVKANRVRPGDECAFEVENVFEGICKVGIVRK